VLKNVQVGVGVHGESCWWTYCGKGARTVRSASRRVGMAWAWLQVSAPLVWGLRLNLSEDGSAQSLLGTDAPDDGCQTSHDGEDDT
jgi:hypothetical protein